MFAWIKRLFTYKLPKGTSGHCQFSLDGPYVECTACNARSLKATGVAPWCRMSMIISPRVGPVSIAKFTPIAEISATEMFAAPSWHAVYADDPRYAALDQVSSTTQKLCVGVHIPVVPAKRASSPVMTADRRTTAKLYTFSKPAADDGNNS